MFSFCELAEIDKMQRIREGPVFYCADENLKVKEGMMFGSIQKLCISLSVGILCLSEVFRTRDKCVLCRFRPKE